MERFTERIEKIKDDIDERLLMLRDARRAYFRTRSDEDKETMDALETELRDLNAQFSAALSEFEAALGLDPSMFDAHEAARRARYDRDLSREHLVDKNVETTATLDDYLPEAVERIRALVPQDWFDSEPRDSAQLNFSDSSEFLSLTKGMRIASELPAMHRFRQMFAVAEVDKEMRTCVEPISEMIEIGAEVFAAELIFPHELFIEELEHRNISRGGCTADHLVELKRTLRSTLSYASLAKMAMHHGFAPKGRFDGTVWRRIEERIYGVPFYRQRARART